jgi:hypothetical protein
MLIVKTVLMEVRMAESRREGQQAQREAERPDEGSRQNTATVGNRERRSEATHQQAERVVEVGRERVRQATEMSATAASGALRSGSAIAEGTREIAEAWALYAEEVMRHTSEASQALLRARTFTEMLEVQAKLLRDNMQAFLDQSTRIADAAGRIATRPFDALKEASADQTRR